MPFDNIQGNKGIYMAANNFIRYEEEIKFEVYEPACIRANSYQADIRKNIKSEKPILTGFLTVKEYAKSLRTK